MDSRKRALVVDDDLPIRVLVMKTLERAGFFTEGAEDGAIAIDKINDGDYDVIVLDMMMPRVDGFGVLDFLGSERSAHLQRTIIATAIPMSELKSRLHHQVRGILSKPFDLEELIQNARNCAGIVA